MTWRRDLAWIYAIVVLTATKLNLSSIPTSPARSSCALEQRQTHWHALGPTAFSGPQRRLTRGYRPHGAAARRPAARESDRASVARAVRSALRSLSLGESVSSARRAPGCSFETRSFETRGQPRLRAASAVELRATEAANSHFE